MVRHPCKKKDPKTEPTLETAQMPQDSVDGKAGKDPPAYYLYLEPLTSYAPKPTS